MLVKHVNSVEMLQVFFLQNMEGDWQGSMAVSTSGLAAYMDWDIIILLNNNIGVYFIFILRHIKCSIINVPI